MTVKLTSADASHDLIELVGCSKLLLKKTEPGRLDDGPSSSWYRFKSTAQVSVSLRTITPMAANRYQRLSMVGSLLVIRPPFGVVLTQEDTGPAPVLLYSLTLTEESGV